MKTININGKEYTKDQFFETISITNYYDSYGCDITDDITEAFWDSQKEDFPRHEPAPPTVRPMSELPDGTEVDIVVQGETKRWWIQGFKAKEDTSFIIQIPKYNDVYIKNKKGEYVNSNGVKLLGWLPKQELPNPNDIKL